MHATGILHRDVKTGNLLLGGNGTVKLGDFGIAELAADLEEEQRNRHSLIGRGKPSGGFHKRHLVRAQPLLETLYSRLNCRSCVLSYQQLQRFQHLRRFWQKQSASLCT